MLVNLEISGPGGRKLLPELEYNERLEEQIHYLADLGLIVVATPITECPYRWETFK